MVQCTLYVSMQCSLWRRMYVVNMNEIATLFVSFTWTSNQYAIDIYKQTNRNNITHMNVEIIFRWIDTKRCKSVVSFRGLTLSGRSWEMWRLEGIRSWGGGSYHQKNHVVVVYYERCTSWNLRRVLAACESREASKRVTSTTESKYVAWKFTSFGCELTGRFHGVLQVAFKNFDSRFWYFMS